MMQQDGYKTRDGVAIPPILYGTAWKKEKTQELVAAARKAGFRGFDTACQPRHYDEAGVGAGLQEALAANEADGVYVQTKFTPITAQDKHSVPYSMDASPEDQVAESFEVSKRNLGAARPTALLLHAPLPDWLDTLRTWRGIEHLHDQGEVEVIGLSNCYDLKVLKTLCNEADTKPAILQNRFHAATGFDAPLRRFCQEQGSVYQSFWTLTANTSALGSVEMTRLSERIGCEPEQILLRYVMQLGIVPLVGTTSTRHMALDMQLDEIELTESDMYRLGRVLPGSFIKAA